MATPSTVLSSRTNHATAKSNALQLISAFKTASGPRMSPHYPNISRRRVAEELKHTMSSAKASGEIHQVQSSLCGPAAFFFSLAETKPDVYVSLIIELFNTGHAQLRNIKLRSSAKARQYNPSRIRETDWMILSSIKPKYDHPSEQFDGITFPGKLEKWFKDAGYSQVDDITNLLSTKNIKTLLNAHNDRQNGYYVCLFVDADIFNKTSLKSGPSSTPNHWVVLNSDIKIREYDEGLSMLKPPATINASLATLIQNEIDQAQSKAEFEADIYEDGSDIDPLESEDRIILNAFTWGDPSNPVYNRTNRAQDAKLYYFLRGFYGYVRAKW